MELRHLRYFIAVAEEMNFHRAAHRLRLSQPSLSQQIRVLEKELGFQLFHRIKRKINLTDAGVRFLDEMRPLMVQLQQVIRSSQQASRGELGQLSIGLVPAADFTILPKLLPLMHSRHQSIRLSFKTMTTTAQTDGIRNGRIDIGFVRLPIKDDLIAVETLVREPLIVALPKAHRLCKYRNVPLRALAQEPYIFFPREMAPSFYDLVVSSCFQAGFSLEVAHEAEHLQTILALVSAGMGLALVPFSVRSIEASDIEFRRLQTPVPHIELGMIYRQDSKSEVLHLVLNTVREVAGKITLKYER